MTDVETPSAKSYRVQIRPIPPEYRTPLASASDMGDFLLPALVSGSLSYAASRIKLAITNPGDRWAIEVIRHATRWREERTVHDEIIDDPAQLIDRAFQLVDFIQRGVPRLTW